MQKKIKKKKRKTKKNNYHGRSVRIENSVNRVTVWHHSASLVMPNSYLRDGIFNPHLTNIKDSSNPTQ